MSECFATIFWRVLCEWSCGSLIAFSLGIGTVFLMGIIISEFCRS